MKTEKAVVIAEAPRSSSSKKQSSSSTNMEEALSRFPESAAIVEGLKKRGTTVDEFVGSSHLEYMSPDNEAYRELKVAFGQLVTANGGEPILIHELDPLDLVLGRGHTIANHPGVSVSVCAFACSFMRSIVLSDTVLVSLNVALAHLAHSLLFPCAIRPFFFFAEYSVSSGMPNQQIVLQRSHASHAQGLGRGKTGDSLCRARDPFCDAT